MVFLDLPCLSDAGLKKVSCLLPAGLQSVLSKFAIVWPLFCSGADGFGRLCSDLRIERPIERLCCAVYVNQVGQVAELTASSSLLVDPLNLLVVYLASSVECVEQSLIYLLRLGHPVESILELEYMFRCPDIVDYLLQQTLIDMSGNAGNSFALRQAAWHRDYQLVQIILRSELADTSEFGSDLPSAQTIAFELKDGTLIRLFVLHENLFDALGNEHVGDPEKALDVSEFIENQKIAFFGETYQLKRDLLAWYRVFLASSSDVDHGDASGFAEQIVRGSTNLIQLQLLFRDSCDSRAELAHRLASFLSNCKILEEPIC